ncbi:16S rRNA (cytidine(1402)-2'-O)-methyltransferase [Mycoplasmoides genitalium]
MKTLKVVATPIGNIQEISERAKKALQDCEVLFCEDSRVTRKMLDLLNIDCKQKKFVINNSFKEKQNLTFAEEFITNFKCCLVSDAGYPSLSDPGNEMINWIISKNKEIKIEVINGPSALMCGLITSGFKTTPLLFLGFLSHKQNQLKNYLSTYQNQKSTIIFFEAVHRLENTLETVKNVFKNNDVFIGRELTKLHESHYWFNTSENTLPDITLKGEFVIVIDNQNINHQTLSSNQYLVYEIKKLMDIGVKLKDACNYLAKKMHLKSSMLYTLFHESI